MPQRQWDIGKLSIEGKYHDDDAPEEQEEQPSHVEQTHNLSSSSYMMKFKKSTTKGILLHIMLQMRNDDCVQCPRNMVKVDFGSKRVPNCEDIDVEPLNKA